jgi:flagellar hook-length control protein FliK
VTDLPAIPVSASPRPAPSAAPRNAEASDDIKQGRREDGLFHEELSREMNTLKAQTPAADDTGNRVEATGRSKTKDGTEESKDAAGTVDASVAAVLAGPTPLPTPAPADANALLAAGEAGIGDASLAAGTSGSLANALSEGYAARASRLRGEASDHARDQAKASGRLNAADSLGAAAGSNPNATERTAGNARTEFALAANAAPAESAARGKSLSAGRDGLEALTALDAGTGQHRTADAPLPAGMNLGSSTSTHATQTAAATAAIAAHVASPGWDRGLGEKVLWMAGQQLQVAELHLNPPELGPLQITLTVNNDQASAQFVSQHASVREAIEAAMPRLREMLAEGGITLGNANVGAESFREQAQQDTRSHLSRGAAQAELGGTFGLTQSLRATRGLVDIFA